MNDLSPKKLRNGKKLNYIFDPRTTESQNNINYNKDSSKNIENQQGQERNLILCLSTNQTGKRGQG